MKHIIETYKDVQSLKWWRTSAKKYKEMDIILFAKMNGSMRSGEYAKYIIIKKEEKKIWLKQVN